MQTPAPLPLALERARADKKLVVFAGAGISMLAPSSLPDWKGFNRTLLDEIKSKATSGIVLDIRGQEAINRLSLDDVGIINFSEAVVKILTGDSYYPVLECLDSDKANANHRALADLARTGVVRAIVTTNFDTLIERAFREANVPLQVALTEQDYARPLRPGTCTLYKIHGSVTRASTLVDTVGQKLRGLPVFVHRRLSDLFAGHHVLVAGYSGGDLSFSADYLSFSAIAPTGPGMTWLVRSASSQSEQACDVIGRAGPNALFHVATLPALFEQLGAAASPAAPASETSVPDGGPAVPVARLLDSTSWRSALGFCIRLLADVGKLDDAFALRSALAADIIETGVSLTTDGPALRALVYTADQLGDHQRKEQWCRAEIRYLEHQRDRSRARDADLYERAERAKRGEGPALHEAVMPYPFPGRITVAEWPRVSLIIDSDIDRLLAGAWGNLSLVLLAAGQLAEAGQALERSIGYCELSGDAISLASTLVAYLQWIGNADRDSQMNGWGTLAEIAGIVSGNVEAANSAALLRAVTLVELGEYDCALTAMQRIRNRKAHGMGVVMAIEVENLWGEIQRRRSQPHLALATWRKSLELAASSAVLGARIRWRIASRLAYDVSMRDAVLAECDQLLRILADAPVTIGIEAVPEKAEVEDLRKRTADGSLERTPDFLTWKLRPTPLSDLRETLIRCEWSGDRPGVFRCLASLCSKATDGDHAVMAARAYLENAKTHSDYGWQVHARSYLGDALFRVGEVHCARAVLKEIEGIRFKADPTFAERISRQIAFIDANPLPPLPLARVLARTLDGELTRRSPSESERLAASALETMQQGFTRLLSLEAIRGYRQIGDGAAVARCYELLARVAEGEGRGAHAALLRERARRIAEAGGNC